METKIFYGYKRRIGCKFLLAKLLIAVGLVLLGLNFGFIPDEFRSVIFSWQMLLLLLGGCSFFYRRFLRGMILILLGGFFIIPKLKNTGYLNQIPENFVETCYPFLLILAGVFIIIWLFLPSKWKRQDFRYGCCGKKEVKIEQNSAKSSDENGNFERNDIFSRGEHIIMDTVFNGGEFHTVFGGSVVDLRHTTLPEGDTFIEINAVFGGMEIFVPPTWNVEIRISDVVFGGFNDKRVIDKSKIDYSRKLVISGSVVFGGGEISN
jgi:predicted membrane protein